MSKAKNDATPKAATKKTGKEKAAKGVKKPAPAVDLEPLRKPVEEARTALAVAEAEAHEMAEKARTLVAGARNTYRAALAPYRDACRKAKHPCEYEGGRGTNVSEKVSFEIAKVEKGVRVTVKGNPDTTEVIPLATLKESVNKAAYA